MDFKEKAFFVFGIILLIGFLGRLYYLVNGDQKLDFQSIMMCVLFLSVGLQLVLQQKKPNN